VQEVKKAVDDAKPGKSCPQSRTLHSPIMFNVNFPAQSDGFF